MGLVGLDFGKLNTLSNLIKSCYLVYITNQIFLSFPKFSLSLPILFFFWEIIVYSWNTINAYSFLLHAYFF